jgi:hypothetical protein
MAPQSFGISHTLWRPHHLPVDLRAEQAAEKFRFLKGTAFRPSITADKPVRLQPLRGRSPPSNDFFRSLFSPCASSLPGECISCRMCLAEALSPIPFPSLYGPAKVTALIQSQNTASKAAFSRSRLYPSASKSFAGISCLLESIAFHGSLRSRSLHSSKRAIKNLGRSADSSSAHSRGNAAAMPRRARLE